MHNHIYAVRLGPLGCSLTKFLIVAHS